MTKEEILNWLADVTDPEVPVLNILDLGIVREISVGMESGVQKVVIWITPTYSGCPAMDTIATGIRMVMASHGVPGVTIEYRLSPAWTTDWMTEAGKTKLKNYGIAPPNRKAFQPLGLFEEEQISCPHCGSAETEVISQFGPTSCKALYRCLICREPFEHFKCH